MIYVITIVAIIFIIWLVYNYTQCCNDNAREHFSIYTPQDLLNYYKNDIAKLFTDLEKKNISKDLLLDPTKYNFIAKKLGVV